MAAEDMAAASNAQPAPAKPDPPADPGPMGALEVDKLKSLPLEQKELYLLSFTSDWSRTIAALDADACTKHQTAVQRQALEILALTSPPLNRVVRNNVANALGRTIGKSDRRLLVPTINKLLDVLNGTSILRTKHAAAQCLGSVMKAAGDSAIMLAGNVCATLVRTLKLAGQHAGMRATCLAALTGTILGIHGSIDESTTRDIWKAGRSAAQSDRSFMVQASACALLAELVASTKFFDTAADIDKLLTCMWKTADSSSALVRHAASKTIATTLFKHFSDDVPPTPVQQQSKKKKKKASDGSDAVDDEPVIVPAVPAKAISYFLSDVLRLFSTQFTKSNATNRLRAAVAVCYKNFFRLLGEQLVERNYLLIVRHCIDDLVCHTVIASNRYRVLLTRKYVRIILHDVIDDMLGERAQLAAAQSLMNGILRDYPPTLKERPEPSKQALIVALSALMAHVDRLQSAFSTYAESCRESLMSVIQHPSYSVQVHAARALRVLVTACPQQLLPTITLCMNSVVRECGHLNNHRQSPRRCTAFATGLAALLKASSNIPLHGSIDVYVRVLDQASKLLKASGTTTLRVSSTQVFVAWTLMGGLMSLGPSFVKPHLPQLLLLWRNALASPGTKEEMSKRNLLELSYLTHVRECSLATLSVFLHYNGRLVTADVGRRIASMLDNTTSFSNLLPIKGPTDDPANRLSPALQLYDLHDMLRRRLYQCCSSLIVANASIVAEIQEFSSVMSSALASFADPERTRPASLSSSITTSASAVNGLWEVGDNWAFGLAGIAQYKRGRPFVFEQNNEQDNKHGCLCDMDARIDALIKEPIGEGLEYDAVQNYMSETSPDQHLPQPPVTEAINAAIGVFALLLPTQYSKVQLGILGQMAAYLGAASNPQADSGKKTAVSVNIATTLLLATKVLKGNSLSTAGRLQGSPVEKAFLDILHDLVADPDDHVRSLAAEALGRLCGLCGSDFTSIEVKALVDLIVSNRESSARAGYALALSHIHEQLGGMAAGFHLNNIVGILMSLAADTSPLVHFWSLESLCRVIQSAGLTFSNHVSSSIGLLSQLYVRDTHNVDNEVVDASNTESTLDTIGAITRCICAIINVLGPDLQDQVKSRNMVLTMLRQLDLETKQTVVSENMRCWELVSIYAPAHLDFETYVRQLQSHLNSPVADVRDTALRAIGDSMRRDAEDVIKVANEGLEDKFWDLLDDDPGHSVIQELFRHWLTQTGLKNLSSWVQRCFAILSRTKMRSDSQAEKAAEPSAPAGPDLQDEEVAGFAADAGAKEGTAAPTVSAELMRWQVRSFAMDLMIQLLAMVLKDTTIRDESPALDALQAQVGEVIKIAFSASTADVGILRIKGLRVIDQILKMFGAIPDPDFTEAVLLEQYQAQITSALTPAFASDSSPELAAEAINVCATFISTGIVTEVDRMGRILKLLVSALETFSVPTETASIGDLKGLSSNAHVMVKMAVYAAWAELQVASAEHQYLVKVVKPHVATLAPLWLSSLQEFARLRFEPDVSDSLGAFQSPEVMYAALNRETILKFYQDAWLKLVEAIASLIDEDSEFVFDALDGKAKSSDTNGSTPISRINYRDEPAAFFFVLFGLAFEALASRVSGDALAEKTRRLEILTALRKILRPSVTGVAIYQEVVFSETMDLFDRMILTEGTDVQTIVVEIARDLCISHPSSRQSGATDEEHLSDDIEQLFELSRIIVLAIAGLIPGLAETGRPVQADSTDEIVTLTTLALDALVDAAEAFPAVIKGDLHACIFHLFTTILATGASQAAVVPQALPILKRFITSICQGPIQNGSAVQQQLSNTLGRFMSILRHAQKRETSSALSCEKNTILASTILVTTAQSLLDSTDKFVLEYLDELIESMNSVATSAMAAGCARSLLLGSVSAGRSSQQLIGQLLSRFVSLLAAPPPEVEELFHSRVVLAQTLVNYACTPQLQEPDGKLALFALVIEALLTRVQRMEATVPDGADEDGDGDDEAAESDMLSPAGRAQAVRHETATRLLELASHDQTMFRATVLRMSDAQKSRLETVLRSASGSGGRRNSDDSETNKKDEEPSIALKMEF